MSETITTVEADVDCTVTLELEAVGQCPFDDVVDEYDITITYTPDGRIVEIRSLSELVASYEDREISHEELCHELYTALHGELEPSSLRVEISPQKYHGIQATVVMGR